MPRPMPPTVTHVPGLGVTHVPGLSVTYVPGLYRVVTPGGYFSVQASHLASAPANGQMRMSSPLNSALPM